jgi:indolepyruvate ferredoxin oxidoreductase alpha subunit
MTGHQPHPGTGKLANGSPGKRIAPEDIARGCGVEFVRVVDPHKLDDVDHTIREALAYDGVTVTVFRRPCALLVKPQAPYRVDLDACKSCQICIRIGCALIDPTLCVGCGLCAQVCTCGAIIRDKNPS